MPKPRESTGGDKRGEILDAAQSLFLRYGVKRTALDDVAREAGVAKGTLYLYFDSKDTLSGSGTEHVLSGSVIASIGGAVSAFITKTFLDVHRPSLLQLNHYFKRIRLSNCTVIPSPDFDC